MCAAATKIGVSHVNVRFSSVVLRALWSTTTAVDGRVGSVAEPRGSAAEEMREAEKKAHEEKHRTRG